MTEGNAIRIAQAQDCRPLRVLLIDAQTTGAPTLKWAIESLGDTVERCDAEAALVMARDFGPDVIIADIALLGPDAGKFCADLHAIKDISNAKVIAQGVTGTVDLSGGGVASQFDLHLKRPIDLLVLADMLSLLRTGMKVVS
ncbi:hypothetical protein ABENE_06945 [Asticcacaulis benevestitus DSM 16100 = ATCC BAA-896]|uniref:Response regulatory domain-containing protein n=1 Tax=Asticcacaulis benevestitus DSM 16100 = ATCC BAA-896 TaxID=1121022 RepID=V4PFS4_9CAUL|nr:hypothetical protein ABENE_06945 [Asticcacaulis benevestitus DSM 16100 = ATCC BAA-896]